MNQLIIIRLSNRRFFFFTLFEIWSFFGINGTVRLALRQFWTDNNSLSLHFLSRSVQPDTWEQIQANFSRQQYLTSLQPQFQPQQQQQQQQLQQTFQHNQRQLQNQQWSNQYGQQSFQRQPGVATSNAQTVFTGKCVRI